MWKQNLLFIFLFFFSSTGVFSQTFNGDAFDLGGGCIQLTPDTSWQSGSVWFPDTLNLDQPFVISCSMNFGTRDGIGADGIAFVLQNTNPFQLGMNGEGLGYQGLNNSLDIEFDTFQNVNLNDPSVDHIAIMRNGVNTHSTPDNLAGPVQAPPVGGNIEDGLDHIVDIKWNPSNFRLEVFFDCSLRLGLNLDIKTSIFGGDNLVYWGFTAGSGGSYNPHRICLLSAPQAPTPPSLAICPGDSVQLVAGLSANSNWTWTPNTNMTDPTIRNPIVFPTQTTTYYCDYIGRCGQASLDSFQVVVINNGAIDLGPDTVLCQNNPLVLDATLPSGTYLWSTGATTPTLSVSTSGTYSVTVSFQGCSVSDTIAVLYSPVSVNLGPDLPLCAGNTIRLEGDSTGNFPGASFLWSDGQTTTSIVATTAGTYSVTISQNGCQAADVITLFPGNFLPQSLPDDTLICNGIPIAIAATPGGIRYLWSTGDTVPAIDVLTPGLYEVTITSTDGCITVDSIEVSSGVPPIVDLGVDSVLCGKEPTRTLNAFVPNSTYQWSTGRTDSVIVATETAVYSVTVTNACGSASDAVDLTFFAFEEGYFFPNVFSPNNDGINDVFRVEAARPEEYRLFVYDRWGSLKFTTQNYQDYWDGGDAPEGVYYYAIHTTNCQGYLVQKMGWVTLVR